MAHHSRRRGGKRRQRHKHTHIEHNKYSWKRYTIRFLHRAGFKLLILFVINFFIFGFLFENFFKENFIIFIVLLFLDLYTLKKILYKRARLIKVISIIIVILIALALAKYLSSEVFAKLGLLSFINTIGGNGELNDGLILASTKDMLKKGYGVSREIKDSAYGELTNSKEDSKKAFDRINLIREEKGITSITWDNQIYELAKYKVDDMLDRHYFDHPDPEGKCVGAYAKRFGLNYPKNSFADNLFGYDSPWVFRQEEAIESWMSSRGHRYNLLYGFHKRGAMACNIQYCIFIGQGGSNWLCDTGSAGLQFWNQVGKQPGEI